MLGKDHINISVAIIIPFLVAFFFLNTGDFLVMVVLLISVLIGSLLPDADCGGKATIYYKFPMIDNFMKKVVVKSVIFIFNHLISKEKIKTEHEIRDEHRGIMHSPIGVFLSSIMLIIPIIIFALIFSLFNLIVILTIFFGLIIGQLLHLFEDSCTISGINWTFPFITTELKGKIYTFSKDPDKKDIRPMLYAWIFYLLIGLLIVGYAFSVLQDINVFLIFILISLYEIIALFVIFKLSKSNSGMWIVRKEVIKKINKHTRRIWGNHTNSPYGF